MWRKIVVLVVIYFSWTSPHLNLHHSFALVIVCLKRFTGKFCRLYDYVGSENCKVDNLRIFGARTELRPTLDTMHRAVYWSTHYCTMDQAIIAHTWEGQLIVSVGHEQYTRERHFVAVWIIYGHVCRRSFVTIRGRCWTGAHAVHSMRWMKFSDCQKLQVAKSRLWRDGLDTVWCQRTNVTEK